MTQFPDNIELTLVYKVDDSEEKYSTERVNAKRVNEYYQLTSIPAFARNLSYGDTVKVELEDGEFHFEELIAESGHSVVHIIIFALKERVEIISTLKKLGCGINSHISENYLVIDIPPSIHYLDIQSFLNQKHLEKSIDYQESCISKIHRPIPN